MVEDDGKAVGLGMIPDFRIARLFRTGQPNVRGTGIELIQRLEQTM